VQNHRPWSGGTARRAGVSPALLVGIAGVLAGLAGIPASSYRVYVLAAATALLLLAIFLAATPRKGSEPTFTIATPAPEQGIPPSGVVMSGTTADLGDDTLWVLESRWILGRYVSTVAGEALVIGNGWSFDYEPRMGPNEKPRRTLTVVRADRKGEGQLRGIVPDSQRRRVVPDPIPGGCTVLDRIPINITAES
jgi:hypothetical protein